MPFDYDPKRLEQVMATRLPRANIKKWFENNAQPYKELMTYYRCAMMAVETKFNILNQEFSLRYDRNPIETIKTRLKSVESIVEKLERRKIFPTVESIEANITDIAGVRVICSYQADIYLLAEALLSQDDVTLVTKKDYIVNPKANGYSSLHLIIETPIFLHDRKRMMKVEVQLRTISMDWWASLEHKIKYKKNIPPDVAKELEKELFECAVVSREIDRRMERIQEKADKYIVD